MQHRHTYGQPVDTDTDGTHRLLLWVLPLEGWHTSQHIMWDTMETASEESSGTASQSLLDQGSLIAI